MNDKIQIKLTTITPEWATQKLEQLRIAVDEGRFRQRSLSQALIAKLTADITAGHWIPNHQGIALAGKEEIVIDGQHRLWAISQANKPVESFVSTGWSLPADADNGLTVMDTIDMGKNRNIANILQIRGVQNACAMTAYAQSTSKIFFGNARCPLSFPQVMDIFKIYKTNYDDMVKIAGNAKGIPAYMGGPLAVYLHTYPRKARELIKDFCFMENLKTGHPALAWHKWKNNTNEKKSGMEASYRNIQRMCNAIWTYDSEDLMTDFKASKDAREWLANQDKAAKSQMREILGMT